MDYHTDGQMETRDRNVYASCQLGKGSVNVLVWNMEWLNQDFSTHNLIIGEAKKSLKKNALKVNWNLTMMGENLPTHPTLLFRLNSPIMASVDP